MIEQCNISTAKPLRASKFSSDVESTWLSCGKYKKDGTLMGSIDYSIHINGANKCAYRDIRMQRGTNDV